MADPFEKALDRSLAWARALRRRTAAWSAGDDRAFHDALFGAPAHDPFSATYPGYVTIRRFADRARPYIEGPGNVADLGCGPGEITCELAWGCPEVRFLGVDHSAVAIEQARRNARRRHVKNVTFEVADLSSYTLPGRMDLVMMFDAFHHLLDPAGFVHRLSAHTDRFLLIEPAGDRFGRWRRTADFDWIASEIDKIRLRIEHELGATPAAAAASPEPPAAAIGRAVENRYPLTDYEVFFAGYHLDVAGTVAGLDVYPAAPDSGTEFRAEVMNEAYRLLALIDKRLIDAGSDLYAKHWVIHAVRGRPQNPPRRRQPIAAPPPSEVRVQGPWDARYREPQVPAEMDAGAEVLAEVTVANESWRTWDSHAPVNPVKLSYHWVDRKGTVVEFDGIRSNMPHALAPGAAVRAAMMIRTPAVPGRYVLQIDLVEEGVTWFSRAGTPPCSCQATITRAART